MSIPPKDTIKGRTIYVLALIVMLNVIYPITSSGDLITLIVYEVLYAGLFIVGIFITSDSRAHIIWPVSIAVTWLVLAVMYALDPTSYWKIQVTYVVLLIFHATITWVLFRYILGAVINCGFLLPVSQG